ncbi:hypothetical protein HFN_0065 [Helicobacter fennelliae MRY12-0050]|uniref:Uncharacterized protein n=1 Tax=Helicobacter fennelliae MRY12-0050 TaxID=1325130 RepID=T1CQD1_9HELI|nr:hypothetical protein HFN_0065 [Helicobacter fennelliae MRY12-0050]
MHYCAIFTFIDYFEVCICAFVLPLPMLKNLSKQFASQMRGKWR